MGIYLGQLPPAEVARLKAELAEMLIANFCYPRFFDCRSETLRMRPVDRAKRQEVWQYLSSFDFTAWGRLDLMSPDFQIQVERLFILYVQRNRSFFGKQGRRRMSDIRLLIGSSASSVVQGLRTHLSNHRQGNSNFGNPRPVVSWSTTSISGRAEPSWEQVASATMSLQQQIQELRGEVKPAAVANDIRPASGALRRPSRQYAAVGSIEQSASSIQAVPNSQFNTRSASLPSSKSVPSSHQAASTISPIVGRRSGTFGDAAEPAPIPKRKSEPLVAPQEVPTVADPVPTRSATSKAYPLAAPEVAPVPPLPAPSRTFAQTTQPMATGQREASMMAIGEDDLAIFEQMRHQLVFWLRVEALNANIEIAGQEATQLLDLLRQNARLDETRLQVVSTLLNLSNQVVKTGMVSILDYKQALMFHLMHTRR